MNWARDNAYIGYTGPDTRKVFRYNPRTSVVVKIAKSNRVLNNLPQQTEQQLADKHCAVSSADMASPLTRTVGQLAWQSMISCSSTKLCNVQQELTLPAAL